ncbi:MAG: cyclic nucleotide-binding domain-containing protein [Candidatus Rokuibacteriota bacterium]
MTDQELVDLIRSLLCRRLGTEEAAALVRTMVARRVPAGGIICGEGEETTGLVLLLTGAAEVLKRGRDGGGAERLATVDAPSVLGEMGLLLDGGRHTATVRAQTECELRVLPKGEFVRLLEAEDVGAYKLVATIAEVLARRLSLMDDKVLELTRRGDPLAPVEELAAFRQKLFTEWRF